MGYITSFEQYVEHTIKDEINKTKYVEFVNWIKNNFLLTLEIRWNQPMFTKDQTFIISVTAAKNHMSVAPEKYTLDYFRKSIQESRYKDSSHLFQIQFKQEINYDLLKRIIDFQIEDKKNYKKFWRET